MQPIIRQLPQSLINKIAAGEVIERPASVVKETLENSIDSGASKIEVLIQKGGTDLIRIADNGCGIPPEQLPLAIASHATSKLQDAEDLFAVRTLGFRGEALASISEISHFILRSRPKDQDSGYELEVRGGSFSEPSPCACPIGTVLEVRNLFFNTPVRRKFMKSPQTEMGHISEAFTRIAIAYPNVHMVLKHNDRLLHDLPPTEHAAQRIRVLFGDEIADGLIPVESSIDATRLFGFVANPNLSRSNNRMQYLFLNGRFIRDRSLQHALGEAYRSLLMVGRFPICFLHLRIPPDEVDVNVHPTKTEVRFTDSGKLYSQLLGTLRQRFLSADLSTASLSQRREMSDEASAIDEARRIDAPHATLPNQHASHASRSPHGTLPSVSSHPPQSAGAAGPDTSNHLFSTRSANASSVPDFQPFPDVFGPRANDWLTQQSQPSSPSIRSQESTDAPAEHAASKNAENHRSPQDRQAFESQTANVESLSPQPGNHLGFQVHNRYLITQDESGMVVVDQHALHERIIYEQLRQRILTKSLETQKLLVPEPISLTPAEAALALDSTEVLRQVGIEIEPFGGDTIVVTSYPAMLANIAPGDMVRQILESIQSEKQPEARELVDSLLHMIACKAAIKAGDRLSSDEIIALLEQRDMYQDTHHCPHGRPTALFFSRDQLDKMFKRT